MSTPTDKYHNTLLFTTMKIGIYSGSFNPIHKGHTRLAEYIVKQGLVDEVWLVVSPNNPLKQRSELADEQLRYEMACLATKHIKNIRVSDIEFDMPKPNYTVNTLRKLNEKYPEHDFSLIIGSDNMSLFHRWRDYETILRDYPVLVYPRKGDDITALEKLYPQMKVISGAPMLPISATEIRAALQQGSHQYDDWLEEEVRKFFLRFCLHISDKNSTFANETK